jgi:hypothetical protein
MADPSSDESESSELPGRDQPEAREAKLANVVLRVCQGATTCEGGVMLDSITGNQVRYF